MTSLLSRIPPPSGWCDRIFPRSVVKSGLCVECGYQGAAQREKRGRDDVEWALWIILALLTVAYVGGYGIKYAVPAFPGLFIRGVSLLGKAFLLFSLLCTLWRISTEFEACPQCQHTPLIPPDSPKGRKILADLK